MSSPWCAFSHAIHSWLCETGTPIVHLTDGEIDTQNHPRIKCQDSGTSFRPGILASRPPLAWSGGPLWIICSLHSPRDPLKRSGQDQWGHSLDDHRSRAPLALSLQEYLHEGICCIIAGLLGTEQWVHLIPVPALASWGLPRCPD